MAARGAPVIDPRRVGRTADVASAIRRLRVAIVDDSELELELALEVFRLLDRPVDVAPFTDGPALLDALRCEATALPDVLLLDMNMPVMPGFDVLAALNDHEVWRTIPAVVLTSSTRTKDVRLAYALRARGVIRKAADFTEFVGQLDAFVAYWLMVAPVHDPV